MYVLYVFVSRLHLLLHSCIQSLAFRSLTDSDTPPAPLCCNQENHTHLPLCSSCNQVILLTPVAHCLCHYSKRTYCNYFCVSDFHFGLLQSNQTQLTDSTVCRSSENCLASSLFLVFSAFSQNGLCLLLLPLSLLHAPGNRNAINFCLVLASLGKFIKVNCPSFTQNTLFWSHIEQIAVIHEAENRVQQCLRGAGEGAGTALCA